MVGIGVGTAASAAIEPIVEPGRQQAWVNASNRVLDPALYAQLVAQGAIDLQAVGQPFAKREGLNEEQFNRLVYLAQRAPELSRVLELWRRGLLGEPTAKDTIALVEHALAKEQIETQWWTPILDLFSGRLDPALIATMVQRSILPNAADPATGDLLLPNQPTVTDSNVPQMPQVPLDTLLEARAHGINFERLAAEARIVGLPASPDLAARMVFRDIITRDAFNQAILEGNTRGEWAPFLFEGFREILTAGQYAELQLRGFLDETGRRKETDKHGMSHDDSDLLYNLLGRSIPEHQITTGEARGGVFEGPIDTIPKAYLQSLQRGNLRPEYYNLAYANRFSYPSGFQIRSETQTGDLSEADAEQILLEIGWAPKWAAFFAKAWASKAGGAALNPWVKAQQTRLVTAMHKAAVKTGVPRTSLEPYLEAIVPDLADRDAIFQLWADERAVDALGAA